jgi:adenosylcobinamide kinase/adenosylcobinamide-phosphate guanylyltransferase
MEGRLPPATLIVGGARSGKSAHAERMACVSSSPVYLATATASDAEMAERIARHRARRGPAWRTVEEPLELAATLQRECAAGRCVVVDCLTLWLSNLMAAERDAEEAISDLVAVLPTLGGPVVLVSNEVGLGIVPDNGVARRFRDLAGQMNQQLAAVAARVVFTAAGLPLVLKDDVPDTAGTSPSKETSA